MEDNKSRKWLYDKLTASGSNVGKDFNEFDNLMNGNEESRKWVYEKARNLGYNVGKDFDEFESLINPVAPTQSKQEDTTAQSPVAMSAQMPAGQKQTQAKQSEPEYVEGFGEGFKQGWQGLVSGSKYLVGEVANAFSGSSMDDKNALGRWDELQKKGVDIAEATKTKNLGDDAIVSENGTLRALSQQEKLDFETIQKAIQEAGGDMDKARKLMEQRAKETTWGDSLKQEAAEEMNQMKPTKGFGAWVGNLAPQMMPSAAALALSYFTKNPKWAKMVGNIGMAGMTASTAGSTMKEARDAGASDMQVWGAGVADGFIEYLTEKLPFDKLTNRIFGNTKKKLSREIADGLANNPQTREEMERLLGEAASSVGLNWKQVGKSVLAQTTAEGLSEAAAGTLQTATQMIYQEPENYPTLYDYVTNAWEGAKAGMFMGAVLGAPVPLAQKVQNDKRRKQQGEVYVAGYINDNGETEVVEVVGSSKDGNLVVFGQSGYKEISPEDVTYAHTFSYQEFKTGELEQEFDNGYNLETPQEMTDAKNMYDMQRQRVADALGEDVLADIDRDPEAAIGKLGEDEQTNRTVIEYLNAKMVYDGMNKRVADDADARIAESDALVDAHTHKKTGMVQGAVMKENDRKVYVVNGNVVPLQDGTGIDLEASDNSIIIRDAESGELEQVSPEVLLSVDAGIDHTAEKQAARDAIQNEVRANAERMQNGVVGFAPGDVYSVLGEDGNTHQVEIVQDNGDNTVTAKVDGEVVGVMAKEQIQNEVDAYNKQRVVLVADSAQGAEAAENAADAKPNYELNAHVTLQTPEGVVTGNINQADNDDNLIEVQVNKPFGGKKAVDMYTREELDNMVVEVADENGNVIWSKPAENAEAAAKAQGAENMNTPTEGGAENVNTAPAAPIVRGKQDQIDAAESIKAGTTPQQMADAYVQEYGDEEGLPLSTAQEKLAQVQEERQKTKDVDLKNGPLRKQEKFWAEVVDLLTPKEEAVAEEGRIKKGDTLQTAASKPHGGIALYKDILANVLDAPSEGKGTDKSVTAEGTAEEVSKNAQNAKQSEQNESANELEKAEKERIDALVPTIEGVAEEAQTADEFVAGLFGNGIRITPESFRKETGLGREEQRRLVGIIAGKEKGGLTVEQAAETIVENYRAELAERGFSGDIMEMRDMVIDLLSSGNPRAYAKQAAARRAEQALHREMEAFDRYTQEAYHMSAEEYIMYEESMLPKYIEQYKDFDEQEYYSNFADEQSTQNEHDTTRESAETGGSREILSEEQPSATPGEGTAGEGQQGGTLQGDVQGNAQEGIARAEAGQEVAEESTGRENQTRFSTSIFDNAERIAREEQRRAPLRKRAREWERILGVKVHLIERLEDVKNPDAIREIQASEKRGKKNVPGWFEGSTGEVFVYLPHVENEKEVDKTCVHEIVSHKGLKELLGQEKFDELCRKVWGIMSPAAREKYSNYPNVHNELEAADEYIAHLSEEVNLNARERSVWQKIMDFFAELLGRKADNRSKAASIVGKETLSRKDIAELVRLSYAEYLQRNGREESVKEAVGLDEGTGFSVEENASFSDRSDAVSDNSSSKGLLNGGSAHLSHSTLAPQEDVAKLLKNNEVTISSAQKVINEGGLRGFTKVETAIRTLGTKLKLQKSKSSMSYYGDFYEGDFIVDGLTLHLRLSTHPANGGRMGNADADDKVSIVIRKDGEHFSPGEHNGYVEYVYEPDEVSLDDAANAILKGVVNLITEGEFIDETGKAHANTYPFIDEEGVARFRTVYHGSAADFNKFDRNFSGSGEGQAVMGAGHYVTTSEGTGRYYAEVASEMRRKVVQEGGYTYNGKVVRSRPLVDAYEALKKSEFDVDKAIESIEHRIAVIRRVKGDKANTTNAEEALRFLNEEKANKGILGYQEEIVEKPERHLYEVEIPDDNGKNYFDLDKKATKKTKDEAKKRLYSALSESEEAENWKKNRDIIEDEWRYNVNTSEATNDSVRATMEQFLTQEEVADILSDMGYVGSKSKATDGTTYIIYKDDNIEIKSNTRFRVSNDNQEIFVSNAQRAVEGIKQDKGTPQQWLAMIEKNGGLKAGEDKWLGLSDWLKGMGKKSVTKDEILDFIGENKIRIEEVTYGEEAGGYSEEKLDEFNAEYEELIWEGEEETGSIYANDWADYAYEAMVARYGDDFRNAFDTEGIGTGSRLVPHYYYDGTLSEEAKQFVGEEGANSNEINSTRLEYTTEGLDNKQEIALTVPTIEPWNQSDDIHFGDAGGGRAVAWIRFGEANDADGKGVLVIDEIQSKRHQEGREKGYNNPMVIQILDRMNEIQKDLYSPYGVSEEVHAENKALQEELEAAFESENPQMKKVAEQIKEKEARLSELNREKAEKENDENVEILKLQDRQLETRNVREYDYYEQEINNIREAQERRDDEIDELRSSIRNLNEEYSHYYNSELRNARIGVIPAPFEKNWHELAMKRMLRYAAENGFDKVAWTTGAQQAERYNLGKYFSDIEREDNPSIEGRRFVLHGGNVEALHVDESGNVIESTIEEAIGKPLVDVVGKSMADRMMSMDNGDMIEGEDLRIGGEGMKGFYDKMLPSFVQKYTKKWGAKVGEVELPHLEEGAQKMWSVDVTHEMKESVMGGQTMFRILPNERLRKLDEGETCNVERVFTQQKMFNFSSGEKIESYEDVAYIFRNLEDEAVENAFVALVKNGKPTIVHLGMGTATQTTVDQQAVIVAIERINPDAVYFVHNHPSGNLKASRQDVLLLDSMKKAYGDIVKDGIIINLRSGKYAVFNEEGIKVEEASPNTPEKEIPAKTYSFSKRVFDKDFDVEELMHVTGSDAVDAYAREHGLVAALTSSQRLGNRDKLSLLVLNPGNRIVGNVFLNHTEVLPSNGGAIGKEIAYYVSAMGGHAGILYGRFDIKKTKHLGDAVIVASAGSVRMLDAISMTEFGGYVSALDEGVMEETPSYGKGETRFRVTDDIEEANARFNEELETLNEENSDSIILSLGRPSDILISAGVEDKPMKLYGNKVIKKMKKHGFSISELRNLPEAVADPIAVFDNLGREGNRSVLTELKTANGNFLVSLDLGKGEEIDFNIVSSVFGKGEDNIVDWFERGLSTYINKEKALNYLHHSALHAVALRSSRLDSAAKVIKDFQNPSVGGGIRFRSVDKLRDRYDKMVRLPNKIGSVKWYENLPYRLREAYQDSMLSLKILQDVILEETGNTMTSGENAYMAENQMSSKNKAEAEMYERDFFKPMMEEVKSLLAAGATYDEVQKYLFAKHGLERNMEMYKKNKQEAIDKWIEERTEQLVNGGMTEADARVQAQQDIALYPSMSDTELDKKYRRDYSGLTALTEKDNVADAEAEATQMVSDFEGRFDTAGLWGKINAATKETLRKSYDSGMMDKATYEKILGMYHYYIPLRGWDADVAEKEYEYLSDRSLNLSPVLVKTEGRTSLADDPIATIGFMAEGAIVQGNRNLMKQRFMNFVLNNPTSLVSVSKQWYVEQADGTWVPDNPQIPADATGDQVAAIVEQHEQKMLSLGKKAKTKRAGLKLDLHATKQEGQEHMVRVKRGGKEYCLYINGSPRAAQALNGMTNPDASNSDLYKAASAVKNFMARMFTSQNPAFVVSNLSRDLIWAGTAVAVRENKDYAARYTKNVGKAFKNATLPRLLHKYQNGTLDMNVEEERLFMEFIKHGGETGFTQITSVEDYKKDIKRFVKEVQKGKFIGKKVWDGFFDAVEFLNRSAEDTTRFMVYMTSRQMGRDVATSVSDAKEITVNFNKKGSGGLGASVMNFCYIFFNAAIQSLSGFGKMMAEHPKRTLAGLTAYASAGVIVPAMSIALQALTGDDDDESYWDLPEWIRRNNLVLYVPFTDSGFITIPLPHELRPFYAMGEIALSAMCGREDVEDGLRKVALNFAEMLPLDFTGNGGNLAVNLTPTIAQPAAQIIANKDYTGKPIYKDYEWNKRDPEWTKAYKGTSPWIVEGTKWLNRRSGGDDVKSGRWDWNPALIEHVLESYTGGAGKTFNRTMKTFQMMWDEDMRQWRNVPVISSFYQSGDERIQGSDVNNRYYEAKDEFEDTKHLLSGYKEKKKEHKPGTADYIEYARKLDELMNSDEYKRYKVFKGRQKAIKKVSDKLKETDDRNRIDSLNTRLMQLKEEMLEELEKADDSPKP